MALTDYLRPIRTIRPEDLEEELAKKGPDATVLIDVRQPPEYEMRHIPGARLMPVSELADRLDELDPRVPTVTYCGIGVRSRAAASVLQRAGFEQVMSLEGGMKTWKGLRATGPVEAGLVFFPDEAPPAVVWAVAWSMEEGARRFYGTAAQQLPEAEAVLFRSLVRAEEAHKKTLEKSDPGAAAGAPTLEERLRALGMTPGEVMEGGLSLGRVLDRMTGATTRDLLEQAMAFEVNAYDVYLKMVERSASELEKKLFRELAVEEREHLRRLAAELEKQTPEP